MLTKNEYKLVFVGINQAILYSLIYVSMKKVTSWKKQKKVVASDLKQEDP